jgi:hypothetical protein
MVSMSFLVHFWNLSYGFGVMLCELCVACDCYLCDVIRYLNVMAYPH